MEAGEGRDCDTLVMLAIRSPDMVCIGTEGVGGCA